MWTGKGQVGQVKDRVDKHRAGWTYTGQGGPGENTRGNRERPGVRKGTRQGGQVQGRVDRENTRETGKDLGYGQGKDKVDQ